ncbi:hypothetical protein KSF_108530 [Reticulibacter mediterranei]|uniref:Uncharacterized protein n=1 Tax=Reticulibacter mediterranei TaxID=2778369 RepID=A0A8J3IYG9_9CHLR|nr:hypothetical protein [Reticulibacter mediterranei]GHP00806.1 hypothetical protein KSF_108530 [Reticulibacter mediterranei]
MRQVIRINWLGESNDGPGLKLYSTYFHPECVADNYPNAVVRALMGEQVDMCHLGSELRTLEALPASPVLDFIDCDQCREPVPQAPSYNARPDAGWFPSSADQRPAAT